MGRVTVQFGQFLFAHVSDITSNGLFVSHVNIYEQQLMSNAYIKKMKIGCSLQNKTDKGKTVWNFSENKLYWF